MARRRKRRKRRGPMVRYVKAARRRRTKTGSYTTTKQKIQLMIGAAAGGFLINNVAGIKTNIEKLPKLGTFELTAGVAAAVTNRFVKNKWLDILSTGLLATGAYELGKAKFSLEGMGGGLGVGEDVPWTDAMTEDELRGIVAEDDVVDVEAE